MCFLWIFGIKRFSLAREVSLYFQSFCGLCAFATSYKILTKTAHVHHVCVAVICRKAIIRQASFKTYDSSANRR